MAAELRLVPRAAGSCGMTCSHAGGSESGKLDTIGLLYNSKRPTSLVDIQQLGHTSLRMHSVPKQNHYLGSKSSDI